MTTGIFFQENEKTVPPSDAISWCSIPQAISWMESGRFSSSNEFDGLLRSCLYAEMNIFTSYPTFWHKPGSSIFRLKSDTWRRLLTLIRDGLIRLRGRPGISFGGAQFINGYYMNDFIRVECVDWGIPEFIGRDCVPEGLLDPEATADLGFICEGWLICGLQPECPSFSYVEVDFCALKKEVSFAPPASTPPIEDGRDLGQAGPTQHSTARQPVNEEKERNSIINCRNKSEPHTAKLLNFSGRREGKFKDGNLNGAIRTQDAAEYLGISKSTLEKYRAYGGGPTYKKIGKICVYAIDDLDEWLKSKSRLSTSE
jgi:predicted DNA-binding transcriptional regulator AlpA